PWFEFAAWKQVYGNIIHLKLVNKHMIILNSKKAALDLLEARSNIYSNRPQSVLLDELLDFDDEVFRVQSDDPRFKIHRRMMHSGLGPRAVREYRPLQTQETSTMLRSMADDPDNFIAHFRRQVAYGYTVTETDDRFVQLVEEQFELVEKKFSLPYMVEFFPILRYLPSWLPFLGFRKAEKIANETGKIDHIPYEWAKQQFESGNCLDSFFTRFYQKEDGSALSKDEERILMRVCGAIYKGGADTTVGVLTSFVYLMETHPEVQKRVQAEIDAATGGERLPLPDDEGKMPYLAAVIKETIRWSPVAPMGIPHSVKQDDIYDGYLIPKGSQVIANIWYATLWIIVPHRVRSNECPAGQSHTTQMSIPIQMPLTLSDILEITHNKIRLISCLDLVVAHAQNTSNILAVFNIEKKLNAQGKPIEPQVEFHGSIVSHLNDFPVKMIVRAPHLLPAA
ncbi:hypothetical protein V5O48_016455, partial [Marasmius crinis-equi]